MQSPTLLGLLSAQELAEGICFGAKLHFAAFWTWLLPPPPKQGTWGRFCPLPLRQSGSALCIGSGERLVGLICVGRGGCSDGRWVPEGGSCEGWDKLLSSPLPESGVRLIVWKERGSKCCQNRVLGTASEVNNEMSWRGKFYSVFPEMSLTPYKASDRLPHPYRFGWAGLLTVS